MDLYSEEVLIYLLMEIGMEVQIIQISDILVKFFIKIDTPPKGYTYNNQNAKDLLAGSYNFTVKDYECFKNLKNKNKVKK